MVKLSENLVLHKTRSESLDAIKNLNLWGNDLDDVSIITRMPNVEICSLSVNAISTLRYFRDSSRIRELYLRKNSVGSIWQVKYLQGLRSLQTLWLMENPVSDSENYRAAVIQMLPNLVKLDNKDIDDEERRSAQLVSIPKDLLPGSNLADAEIDRLSGLNTESSAQPAEHGSATLRHVQSEPVKPSRGSNHHDDAGTNRQRYNSNSNSNQQHQDAHQPSSQAAAMASSSSSSSSLSSNYASEGKVPANIAYSQNAQSSSGRQQHQHHQPSRVSKTLSAEKSPVVYAILSLLNVLDDDSLRIVKAEVDHRLSRRSR